MVNIGDIYRYIIDTSSILSQKDNEPHRRSINKTLWKHIDELIVQHRIVTCSEIIEEVYDEYTNRDFADLPEPGDPTVPSFEQVEFPVPAEPAAMAVARGQFLHSTDRSNAAWGDFDNDGYLEVTYSGNNAKSREINLGFQPVAVMLENSYGRRPGPLTPIWSPTCTASMWRGKSG